MSRRVLGRRQYEGVVPVQVMERPSDTINALLAAELSGLKSPTSIFPIIILADLKGVVSKDVEWTEELPNTAQIVLFDEIGLIRTSKSRIELRFCVDEKMPFGSVLF